MHSLGVFVSPRLLLGITHNRLHQHTIAFNMDEPLTQLRLVVPVLVQENNSGATESAVQDLTLHRWPLHSAEVHCDSETPPNRIPAGQQECAQYREKITMTYQLIQCCKDGRQSKIREISSTSSVSRVKSDTRPLQVLEDAMKCPHNLHFSRLKNPSSQPASRGEVLETPDDLCGPHLDLLQQDQMLPMSGVPKWDTVLHSGAPQSGTEGDYNLN
ncbi:hypothetical protein TURU_159854 [Turdus rufiventris]|nr:hypothetical protein TURU_159854 [Turdus rufiventris]